MSLSRCNYRINDLGGRCQLLQGHDGGIHDVEAEVRRRVAEELAPRRADKDFMDRITKRVHDDQRLLDRLADDPPPTGLTDLPMGLYVGANRYDTDDQHVLHLWSQDGRSFDVTWPKDPPAGSPEGRPNADTEARQSEDFLTAEVTLSTADTKREYLEREAARSDPLRHAQPTHGEDGEALPDLRRFIRPRATGCVLIAPVCGNCGGEVDVIDGQWWHVRDVPSGSPEGSSLSAEADDA